MLLSSPPEGSVTKRQTSQTTSDYKWLQETTSDFEWLRVTTSEYEWLQGTTSDYEPDYEWLRVTTSDYKPLQATTSDSKWLRARLWVTTSDHEWLSDYQSSYEWLQPGLAINLGIKTFIVSYDFTTMNEINTLKRVLKIVVLRFWWKSLKNTCDAESSRLQMFFKVSALKKAFNPTSFLKRDSNTRVFQWNSQNL